VVSEHAKCLPPLLTASRQVHDGPVMARWFYEDLLSNKVIDADAVAYALDAAVEKLRATMPLEPTRWAPYIHMGA
jgi:hypothetical protein